MSPLEALGSYFLYSPLTLCKVAIARAIPKEPRILPLDESTASLGIETESHIQASLDQLSQDRTTMMIA